ncbi:hypothetical protein [Brucella anthropi]|uniref:hypothetical protein n=1 Tax=Brucella anthropi TaxID=529 RepID=UPI003D97B098
MIIASMLAFCTAAQAGFPSWRTETEDDPFTGGKKITVDNLVSLRSVPGFEYSPGLDGFKPTASFAIDGKKLFDADSEVDAVGNNIAAASFKLDAEQSTEFVNTFMASKKQVAMKDGIADRPQLLSANGSTKAGQKLMPCVDEQKKQDDLTH